MIRVFYRVVAAPVLFILRVIFFPFKIVFRFLKWLISYISDRIRFKKADFDLMEGHEFEEYFAEVLLKNRFTHVEVTKGSGDQGVDVLAIRDGVSYAIQCKNYKGKISNKAVQEAYAGARFYGCDVPVVVTNSWFYPSAEELADEIGVELWDREELLKLVKRAGRRG